jgi:hypothetical protein
VLFMARHWLSIIYIRYAREKPSIFSKHLAGILKYGKYSLNVKSPQLTSYSSLRRCLSRKIFGLLLNRLLLYITYWIINLVILETDVKLTTEYVELPNYVILRSYTDGNLVGKTTWLVSIYLLGINWSLSPNYNN